MKNRVTNFSVINEDLIDSDRIKTLISTPVKTGMVDVAFTAKEAARLAEDEGFDLVVVRDEGTPVGVFVPGYLHDLLPDHARGIEVGLTADMSLQAMIERFDQSGVEFHSERVNFYPTLWQCPHGHITSANPCPRHHISTEPYP